MSLLVQALQAIPSHREPPLLPDALARDLAGSAAAAPDAAREAVQITLDVLRLFDVLDESGAGVRLAGQTQNYLRLSLVWYLQQHKPIASNWSRSGTAREITVSNLLDQAPYLLKALEQRRLALSVQGKLPLVATREQPCSVVLVKIAYQGRAFILHQWDQKAERFQPIGGKQRAAETPDETARREFLEEIAEQSLLEGRDFTISRLLPDPIVEFEISRTYGALTRYEIHVFSATLHVPELKLAESDRWISLDEMRAQKTGSGSLIAGLGRTLSLAHPQALEHLSPAFDFRGRIDESAPPPAADQSAAAAAPLPVPDKVTLPWLVKNVPVTLWLSAATIAGVLFVAGVQSTRLTLVKQIFFPAPAEVAAKTNPAPAAMPENAASGTR